MSTARRTRAIRPLRGGSVMAASDYRDVSAASAVFLPAAELDLVVTGACQPLVLLEYERETLSDRPMLLYIAPARDSYEAWRTVFTGQIDPEINPTDRAPMSVLAEVFADRAPPGPADMLVIRIIVSDFSGREIECDAFAAIAPGLRALMETH